MIVKIANGDEGPAPLDIRLEGLPAGQALAAERFVLTGPGTDAVNEDGLPPAVSPRSERVEVSGRFEYVAPAVSLTVFRFAHP